MALTDKEKTTALYYLGWPGKSLQSTSQLFNSVVDDRLKNLPSALETRVKNLLKRLEALDEALDCAVPRTGARRIVGEVEMNPNELDDLRKERLRQIRELSDMLDLEIVRQGRKMNMGLIV